MDYSMKNKNGGIPPVTDSVSPLSPEEIQMTLDMVGRQTSFSPLKEHYKSVAFARQQVHTSGTSDIKVAKKFVPKTPKTVSAKKLSKDEIQLRRAAKMNFKVHSLSGCVKDAYQGIFDTKVKFSIEEATTNNMKILMDNLLEKIKSSINESKVTINHVLNMDSALLSKVVISSAFMISGICFCGAFSDTSLFVKFLFTSIATIAAAYPFLNDIKDIMMSRAAVALTGVDMFKTIREMEIPTQEDIDMMNAHWAERDRIYEANKAARVAAEQTFIEKCSAQVREWALYYESGLEEFAPMMHMVCEFIASIAGVITGFCFTGDISRVVRSIVTSAKAKTDLQCIINEALKWISGHIDNVAGTSFRDMFAQNSELENWGESVHSMYTAYSSGSLELVPSNSQRINALTVRGGEIARKHMTMPAGSWAYHRYCCGMLSKMEAHFNGAGMPAEERQIPLCVILRGASGVGKSYITNALIDQLAMRVLKGERLEQYVHDHSKEKWLFLPEEDHANGYNCQFATIIDDFGQFKTQKGQKDDMQQIIRWCNAAPCRLNAAELEKKGSLVFNSPLVIASTNLYEYWSPSLALPEALVRRFDIWVDVVPRVEFCTEATMSSDPKDRRLDRNKIPSALEFDLCEYRLLKVTDAIQQKFALDKILTFSELVQHMVEKFERNKKAHEDLMVCLRKERERLFKEMTSPETPHYEGVFDAVKSWFGFSKGVALTGFDIARQKFRDFVLNSTIEVYLKRNKELLIIGALICAIVGVFLVIKCCTFFSRRFFSKRSVFNPGYEAELMSTKKEPLLFSNMLIKSIIDRNVYHMYRVGDDPSNEESFGTLTMIQGRIGMLNAHYIAQMKVVLDKKLETHVRLVKHGNLKVTYMIPIERFIDATNMVIDHESDLALVDFGDVVPVCRDILPFFCTNEAYEQNRDFEAILVTCRSPHFLHTYRVKDTLVSKPINVCGNVHTDVVIYEADTHTGDCGSLLYYSGDFPNTTERIVGMHMAGVAGTGAKKGYATIITQKKLKHMLDQMEVGPIRVFDIVPEGSVLKEESSHELVKKVDRPVFQPSKTSIEPSLLYNMLHPVTKAPAHLSTFTDEEGNEVSPLMKAHKKQDSQNVSVDYKQLDIVKKEVLQELSQFMRHTGSKLTFDESIVGRSDLKALGPIPRKTSAGYTYSGDSRVRNGKKEFFGREGEYILEGPLYDDLKERVNKLEAEMLNNIVPEDRVYMDILKDETLPLGKVAIGKTRMISACDLPMSVLYRRYFGCVCNDLVASRLINGMAIGMNPYSEEWQFLAVLLRAKGNKVVAGDFGSYDNSQSCQLIEAVVWIMSELTGLTSLEDRRVLSCLAVTLSQPYHISGSKIYELDHGMPSGNPMTSIMNSIFGLVVFRLCWAEIMSPYYSTYVSCVRAFNVHVKLVMYGDDNLLNISDEVIDKFNQTSMMSTFPKFGLTYTSDEKEDKNPPPFRSIDKVTFLKRSFVWNDEMGRYVAALDIPTIYNMLHYTKKGGSSVSITIDNCDNAIRESAFHGRVFYEYMVRRLKPLAKEIIGCDLVIDDYETAVYEVAGLKPAWIKEHI